MSSPFEKLTAVALKRWFWSAFALHAIAIGVLTISGAPLKTDVAPQGIVSFELAHTTSAAVEIMNSWGPSGLIRAGFSLGFDFLFLLVYPVVIALGCEMVIRRRPMWGRVGAFLAWGQLLAGALDAVENTALYALLLGQRQDWLAPLAYWTASVKFLLVMLGIGFVLLGLIIPQRSPPPS